AWAFDFTALKPEGYVSDFARVLDAGSRAQLEEYCARLERATGAQMALVTLPTLYQEPVEDVANALFRKWGIGQKGKDEGILLLLVIGDRRSRLEVGYGLEPVIPDGYAGSILRLMRPALRERQYGAALMTAAQEIGDRITKAKGVTLETRLPVRRHREGGVPVPLLLFLGGVGTLVLLSVLTGGRRRGRFGGGAGDVLAGILIGNLLGRSTGYRSGGGGFGGFDSGDSFGGFGGGDSGGGGASGSW
ncbi:MAG: TPM domain-containing protein, partial [Acidobacteriota bacterium]